MSFSFNLVEFFTIGQRIFKDIEGLIEKLFQLKKERSKIDHRQEILTDESWRKRYLLSCKFGDCVMVTLAPSTSPFLVFMNSITMSFFRGKGRGGGKKYSKLSYDSRKLDSESLQNHHPLGSVSS